MARHVSRHQLLAAGLLLMLLPFVLFWRLWWPDARQRQAFAYGDFVEQYYPMRTFVAYELRHGRLPLWDPYTYSGQPAAGASLYAPFYPLGLWEALFPDPLPFAALEVEALLHLGMAGVFTFLLARRLTGRSGAGLLAGLAFSLGGFLTSYPVQQLLILETAAWLPAVLWLLDLALERRSLILSMGAGAALGCALLAGHPQTFLYIAYLSAGFFLARAWHYRTGLRAAVAVAAVTGLLALSLGAVQWLPTLELSRLSPRAHLTYDDVAHGFALADAWGALRANAGQLSPLYVGLLPALLALAAVILARRGQAWFWALVAAVALLLSFGRNAFLYPLVYGRLPGFGMFRNQERAAFLVSFALAVLAAYGYNALKDALARYHEPAGALADQASAGAAGGISVLKSLERLLLPALLVVTFIDLFHANAGLVLAPEPAGGWFAMTPAVAQVQAVSLPGWRTSSEGLLPGDGNGGLVFRLRDVAGNSPLHLQDYDRFLDIVPEVRWWQLLNVQHILTRRPLSHGALKLVRQDGDVRLYQVFVQGQPAWISHAFLVAPDQASALAETARPGLDVRSVTVLESPPGIRPAAPEGGATLEEKVDLLVLEPGREVAQARLAVPGLLVFSEIAYPGWVPYVSPVAGPDGNVAVSEDRDGAGLPHPWPALRAFGLLRAVALPTGLWRVEWRYEPASVRLGGVLSAAAVLVVALSLITRKIHRS